MSWTRRHTQVLAWAAGGAMVLCGAGLVFWPESDSPEPFRLGAVCAHPIDVVSPPVRAALSPSFPQLAEVARLEAQRDEQALERLALAPPTGVPEETRVRVTALHALANVGGPRGTQVLHEVLADSQRDLVLRLASASALARRGREGDVGYLKTRLAEEPLRAVREKIRLVLDARAN